MGWNVRLPFFFASIFASLAASPASGARLNMDLFDSSNKVAESWKLDGNLSCEWKGKDLVVKFEDKAKKDLKDLTFRIPSLKRYLLNARIHTTLDAKPSSELSLTDAVGMEWTMVPTDNQHSWVGSECSVETISIQKGQELSFQSVKCQQVVHKDPNLSGLLNFEISSEGEQEFNCKPKTNP